MGSLLFILLTSLTLSAAKPSWSNQVPDLTALKDIVLDFGPGEMLRLQAGNVLVGWKYASKKPNCLLHAYDSQNKPIRGRVTITRGDSLKAKHIPQRADRLTGHLAFVLGQNFELNMICFGTINGTRPMAFNQAHFNEIIKNTFQVTSK